MIFLSSVLQVGSTKSFMCVERLEVTFVHTLAYLMVLEGGADEGGHVSSFG